MQLKIWRYWVLAVEGESYRIGTSNKKWTVVPVQEEEESGGGGDEEAEE